MHLLFSFIIIYFAWRFSDWKNWTKYHPTMLFLSTIELIYVYIVSQCNYYLWRMVPDSYLGPIPMMVLYTFIIFPGTTLLFLSKYPQGLKQQAVHITKWVIYYSLTEWLASLTGRIIYVHHWGLFSSIVFDFILFWGLAFHHKRPLMAYMVFILVTAFGIWAYHIPINFK